MICPYCGSTMHLRVSFQGIEIDVKNLHAPDKIKNIPIHVNCVRPFGDLKWEKQ